MQNIRQVPALLALGAALLLPMSAQAHRAWMLPSATVLSGENPWVTVDAAISNDLFYFEHVPMRLDGLVVTGPDGEAVTPQNAATGKYRSTFDIELAKPGTYRISSVGDGVVASYTVNGETKRWRGAAADLATAIPQDAENVKVTHSQRRIETFATAGAPTVEALKPAGAGLELEPVTHPNDLFAGEAASFRLLLDGKPAPDVEVALVPGGSRYRTESGETALRTGPDGVFTVTWPAPGLYWLEASTRAGKSPTVADAERSATYAATLEVLND